MKEPVVTDSTCLIGLERIGHLDILPALFEPILVPPEVQHEFGTPLPWLTVETPIDQALVAALKILLDSGEAEAIALAHEQGRRIILDDRRARSVARSLGVTIIGTVDSQISYQRTHGRMISCGKWAPLKLTAIVVLPLLSPWGIGREHTPNRLK